MPVGVSVFSLRLTGEQLFKEYTAILSSELRSDGRDTEPRGTVVKRQWNGSRVEGKQGGIKKITL